MSKAAETPATGHSTAAQARSSSSLLPVWIAIYLLIQGIAWLSSQRGAGLAQAVEEGRARVETQSIGELGDEAIRKAIGLQQDTLPFWAALVALGDFVLGPLLLVVRALLAAALFAAAAALVGRPTKFAASFAACGRFQGFWVLGMAFRLILPLALNTPEVQTSATLFLSGSEYPAPLWVSLQQIDAFALLGWAAMAGAAWSLGQLALLPAALITLLLASMEACLHISLVLFLGAGMRLALFPS